MAKSEISKSAAASTPAAQPSASQAAAESDALPSRGAVRGDMLGIKGALASELDQLSDGQNDETDAADATEETARLGDFDEQQAAEAASELAGDQTPEDTDAEAAPEGEEAPVASDATEAEETPESQPDPNKPADEAADAEKQKVPEGVQTRINELTARAKTAEERLATAEEQLAAYRARDEGALTPDVLDHVETPEDLTTAQKRYNALLSWAIQNPDGGKLGDKEYSAEEVRTLHAEAQSLINEAIPSRREYLQQRVEFDREAVNFYPWLKDTTKGAGALVTQAIKEVPALRKMPNYRLAVADAVVGQALRQAGVQLTDSLLKRLADEQKATRAKAAPAAAKPQPGATPARPAQVKPPSAPSKAGVLPPRLAPRAAAAKAAGQRLRKGAGTEDDLAASIASKL